MPQSLVNNVLHFVTSTKHRDPFIDAAIEPQLHAYMLGILGNMKCIPIEIGGMPDHVHILFALSKNMALCDVVEELKKSSSGWIKKQGEAYANFYWQGGYAAFSVSASNVETVRAYIRNQKTHHAAMTFQDELRQLFRKHGVEFDERYVWD